MDLISKTLLHTKKTMMLATEKEYEEQDEDPPKRVQLKKVAFPPTGVFGSVETKNLLQLIHIRMLALMTVFYCKNVKLGRITKCFKQASKQDECQSYLCCE